VSRASAVTTHVLDTARGQPAAGVAVRLELLAETGPVPVGQSVTDADGRSRDLGPVLLPPGSYRLVFDITAFFPEVAVTFLVTGDAPHQHVPLLLSPFAYSTYRGS
jgi:5-hydroxyisourate hydrolase